jgi:ABC-2 type transport system permease protein
MFGLIGSSIAKFAAYSGNGQSIADLLKGFPKSFQILFGLNGFDMTTVQGYVGVTFMYIALMATIHAVLLGSGIISKEERDKTSEFLLSKPISRTKVITAKLLAGVFNIGVLNLATYFSLIYFTGIFNKGDVPSTYIGLLAIGLLFMQMIFFFLGAVVAAVVKRPKSAGSMASAVLLGTFILMFFINLNSSLDNLKYLTPFKYFDAKDILASNSVSGVYIIITVVLVTVMIFTTYIAYNRRDLSD